MVFWLSLAFMNDTIRCAFSILAAALLLIAPAEASAIPTAGAAGGRGAAHSHIGMNPHLHGATAVAHPEEKKGHPPERPERPPESPAHPGDDRFHHPDRPDHRPERREVTMVHHVWSNRWDYVAWRVTHLHYGEIRGFVVNAAGEPVRGAHVVLQRPGGKPFRYAWKKHATATDASGRFVMTHVLAQSYRLSTHHGYVEITVHPGTLTMPVVNFQ